MALKEYLGAIIMEIDGQEIEVASVDTSHSTGRRPVKTMNRSGKVSGYSEGVKEYALSVSVPIPAEGDYDWASIKGAKITIYPVSEHGKRKVYTGCVTLSVGEKYAVDREAMRDLSMMATDHYEE